MLHTCPRRSHEAGSCFDINVCAAIRLFEEAMNILCDKIGSLFRNVVATVNIPTIDLNIWTSDILPLERRGVSHFYQGCFCGKWNA